MAASSVDHAIFTSDNKIIHVSSQKGHAGYCNWLGLFVVKFNRFLKLKTELNILDVRDHRQLIRSASVGLAKESI